MIPLPRRSPGAIGWLASAVATALTPPDHHTLHGAAGCGLSPGTSGAAASWHLGGGDTARPGPERQLLALRPQEGGTARVEHKPPLSPESLAFIGSWDRLKRGADLGFHLLPGGRPALSDTLTTAPRGGRWPRPVQAASTPANSTSTYRSGLDGALPPSSAWEELKLYRSFAEASSTAYIAGRCWPCDDEHVHRLGRGGCRKRHPASMPMVETPTGAPSARSWHGGVGIEQARISSRRVPSAAGSRPLAARHRIRQGGSRRGPTSAWTPLRAAHLGLQLAHRSDVIGRQSA